MYDAEYLELWQDQDTWCVSRCEHSAAYQGEARCCATYPEHQYPQALDRARQIARRDGLALYEQGLRIASREQIVMEDALLSALGPCPEVETAARDWIDRGLGPEDAAAWCAIGCQSAATAQRWREEGLTPQDITQAIADATYTIRRPGCHAWITGVRAVEVPRRYAEAEERVSGHIIVGETGAVEGEVLTLAQIEAAIHAME